MIEEVYAGGLNPDLYIRKFSKYLKTLGKQCEHSRVTKNVELMEESSSMQPLVYLGLVFQWYNQDI